MEITGLRGFVQFGFDPRKRVVFPADLVTFISFGRGNTCYGGTHIDVLTSDCCDTSATSN